MLIEIQVILLSGFFVLSNLLIIFFGLENLQKLDRQIFVISSITNLFLFLMIFLDFYFLNLNIIFLRDSEGKVALDFLLSPFSIGFLLTFPIPFIMYKKTHKWTQKIIKQNSFLISLLYFIGFIVNAVLLILKMFSINVSFNNSVSLLDIMIIIRLILLLEASFYMIIFGQKTNKREIFYSGIFYFCFFTVPILFLFWG
jgi:hypothetical protein